MLDTEQPQDSMMMLLPIGSFLDLAASNSARQSKGTTAHNNKSLKSLLSESSIFQSGVVYVRDEP